MVDTPSTEVLQVVSGLNATAPSPFPPAARGLVLLVMAVLEARSASSVPTNVTFLRALPKGEFFVPPSAVSTVCTFALSHSRLASAAAAAAAAEVDAAAMADRQSSSRGLPTDVSTEGVSLSVCASSLLLPDPVWLQDQ